MNTTELLTTLNEKGVRLWADKDKLRINAPKGAMNGQLKQEIAAQKTQILEHLCKPRDCGTETLSDRTQKTASGLSLRTIGRLVGGEKGASPVVNSQVMASQLRITFRPLPQSLSQSRQISNEIIQLRTELEETLRTQGVQIVPWEKATRPFNYALPVIGKVINKLLPQEKQPTMSVVRSDITAVIDVERPSNRHKTCLAEHLYRATAQLSGKPTSIAEITQRIGWAEDHAIQKLEDPTATQVVLLTALDERFTNPDLPYEEKIGLGIDTLISQFSEIVIGTSGKTLSILNMNLSDSLFESAQLETFVQRSLIPKLYVPIAPLPLSRFEVSHYSPQDSPYAQKLAALSKSLSNTGLFPSGFKLAEVVRRQSHRDIVSAIVNGRTGVSYGFVAYAEPPQYVGKVDICTQEWETLLPVEALPFEEIRQNAAGRQYLKTAIGDRTLYKQIPDLWLVCSRSGANKTDLDISQDILRLGVQGIQSKLKLQAASGLDVSTADIKPSYDTYVMIAIALASALYTPELIANGAPIIHFHGYPHQDWFAPHEDYAGTGNPAVPCGTYESGVFNFLSIQQLASSQQRPLSLVGLIEPDHGINLLAKDVDYLLSRIEAGLQATQIELGGKYLPALRQREETDS